MQRGLSAIAEHVVPLTMSSDRRLVYDKRLNDRHSVTLVKH